MPHAVSRFIQRTCLAILVVASVCVGPASRADDNDRAQAPPEVKSLDDALAVAQRTHPSRVLKAELEHEDDGPPEWVYEIKLLTSDGRVLEVKLDAVSLELVGVEGRTSQHSGDD